MFRTLVDAKTLAAHLADPQWVVCDCRFRLSDADAGRRAYAQGHIPGARYAHLNEDLASPVGANTGRHPLPAPERFAQTLGAWGIDAHTQVVAYDDSFGSMAARLWWLLRWLGHDAVAVLDGGIQAWQRAGGALSSEAPVVTPKTFVARPNDALWVDAGFVQQAMAQGTHVLIDARAEERFSGESEPFDKVAGHVPGAINSPFEDNLSVASSFQSPAELRAQYAALLAGKAPTQTIHMCGSGVTACHNLLAMEHAGLSGAKLYAGSWSEWITDARRPVATGGGT